MTKVIAEYRQKISDIVFPAFAEKKLDGEFVTWNAFEGMLTNGYGRAYNKVSTKDFPKNCMLFGELYVGAGKEYYSELHSHRLEWDKYKVSFFDVLKLKSKFQYGVVPYKVRREILIGVADEVTYAKRVRNEGEVNELFEELVNEQGYEGLVVKPEDSLTSESWVKLKREYADKVYIVGVRKDRNAITVGNGKGHIYCSVSINGFWKELVHKALENESVSVVGEDKENWLIDAKVVVEVKHNGYINERERAKLKFRHPRLKRICNAESILTCV